MTVTRSNEVIVSNAFAQRRAAEGSFYNPRTDNASAPIAGDSPHCGAYSMVQFTEDRTAPFQARFPASSTPALIKSDVTPYVDSHAYFIAMTGGRAEALALFLDTSAFDDGRSRCPSARPSTESPQ